MLKFKDYVEERFEHLQECDFRALEEDRQKLKTRVDALEKQVETLDLRCSALAKRLDQMNCDHEYVLDDYFVNVHFLGGGSCTKLSTICKKCGAIRYFDSELEYLYYKKGNLQLDQSDIEDRIAALEAEKK